MKVNDRILFRDTKVEGYYANVTDGVIQEISEKGYMKITCDSGTIWRTTSQIDLLEILDPNYGMEKPKQSELLTD